MASLHFVSVVVIVLALTHASFGTFQGQWTDSKYKYGMRCCVVGNELSCFYSDVGIVVGEVSGTTATGSWYEASDFNDECGYGTFRIDLVPDNSGFVGSRVCSDGSSETLWSENRLDLPNPDFFQCARLAPEGTLMSGRWGNITEKAWEDVCVSNITAGAQVSYTTQVLEIKKNTENKTTTVEGYVAARKFEGGRIIAGRYTEKKSRGLELMWVAYDASLAFSWWDGDYNEPINTDNVFTRSKHAVVYGVPRDETQPIDVRGECPRNANVKYDPNSSATIAWPVSMVFVVMLVLALVFNF